MATTALSMKDVHHLYKKGSQIGAQMVIPNWEIEQGESVFLYGDSGSGKSTLLNLLSGVLTAQSGTIEIMGKALTDMSNAQRDRFRAQHIGVVFQTFNLIPYLPVLKNIQLAAYLAKKDIHAVVQKAESLLSDLNMKSDILGKPVNELSIGQQQRVAIVRALINSPELLLVDEPTSALDASARDAFMQVLMDIVSATGTTMIFVSHDNSLKPYFKKATDIKSITDAGGAQ